MGVMPADPPGWRRTMGRDAAAIGPGVIKHVGRMSRQRVQPHKGGGGTLVLAGAGQWQQRPLEGVGGTLDGLEGNSAAFTIPEPLNGGPSAFWHITLEFVWTVTANLAARTLPLAVRTGWEGGAGPMCPLGEGITTGSCGLSFGLVLAPGELSVSLSIQGYDLDDVFDGTDGTWSVNGYLAYEFVAELEED